MQRLFNIHFLTILLLIPSGSTLAQAPPAEGLVLWLDASDASTIEKDDEDRVRVWRDRSGLSHHAEATLPAMPQYVAGPKVAGLMAESPKSAMIRFTPDDVPSPLEVPALRKTLGPITVFVVASRNDEQANRGQWQRLLSVAEDEKKDNEGDGLAMTMTPSGGGESTPLAIFSVSKSQVVGKPMTIGTVTPSQLGGGMLADVAELLVYDREFSDPAEFEAVEDYLANKWHVNAARHAGGWNHQGPLPPAPTRISTRLPLFDQVNSGGWQSIAAMTDEFNGDTLDSEKWWDHYPSWHGRVPARFLPENVKVSDGQLQMTLCKDTTLPREQLHKDIQEYYENYSASAVVSKTAITYGCFEVRIKPANATCTSSWWFNGGASDKNGIKRRNELDVFELPAGCAGHEHRFGMNMHVFAEPETDHHWSNWGNWEAPFRWSEDFHTVNFVWSPEWIRYYVDGHCIRTTRNVAWHVPLQMIFDMEIMSWLPFPDDTEFPATYDIDYVRAWTRADWQADPIWTAEPDPAKPSGVTDAVRKLTRLRAESNSATEINAVPKR